MPATARRIAMVFAATGALLATAVTAAPAGFAAPGAPAPVLAALSTTTSLPTPAGVSRALAAALADPGLGGAPHVEVIDASTGRVLLDHAGRVPTIPASTEKLVTAAAALTVLGPRTRLPTRVYAAGGNVYLVGGGDPTLSTAPLLTGYPFGADLGTLARTAARKIRSATHAIAIGADYAGPDQAPGWTDSYLVEGEIARVRSLLVDEGKLAPGLAPGPRVADPLLSAAQAFQKALQAAGVRSTDAQASPARTPPRGATLIATAMSPPVSALIERMLSFSDADIAEGLARQVAVRLGRPATFAGVAQALTQVARRLGLPELGHFEDGSGLSRANAIAPALLTALLRAAALGQPRELAPLVADLPVAGFSGTLALRFTGFAAVADGQVRAKTGWLNGAAALAGFVTTREGRLLIFAALVPAPVRAAGEAALDRLAATLASCGCR